MRTAERLASLLRPLTPVGTAVDVRPIGDYEDSLFISEAKLVARAVPRRRREFATGRASARAAMKALGLPRQPIHAGPAREPILPEGFVGSITHDEGLCVTVLRPRDGLSGLGVDLTAATPLDEGLRRLICTADEDHEAAAARGMGPGERRKLVFSAKEALYKAIYPTVRRYVDFLEIRVEFDDEKGRWWPIYLTANLSRSGIRAEGRFLIHDGTIATTAWSIDTQGGHSHRHAAPAVTELGSASGLLP